MDRDFMSEIPKRKDICLKEYDYSAPGAYFVTICTKYRAPILWEAVGAAICRPQDISLSAAGKVVEQGVLQIPNHYESISVDKFCIMPDHVHLLLVIRGNEDGRQVAAPTVSTVTGHMKRWVSMQIGRSIWQKSFFEHGIRNQQDYDETWRYIENNPFKYIEKRTP